MTLPLSEIVCALRRIALRIDIRGALGYDSISNEGSRMPVAVNKSRVLCGIGCPCCWEIRPTNATEQTVFCYLANRRMNDERYTIH